MEVEKYLEESQKYIDQYGHDWYDLPDEVPDFDNDPENCLVRVTYPSGEILEVRAETYEQLEAGFSPAVTINLV